MNEKKPPSIKEVFDLALHNHQKNNLKVAEKLYKQILEIKSDHFESTFYLGSLSIQTKNFDRAKQLLQRAIQIQPNYASAHNNLGIVFQELGEREKAKSCYEKAIQIDPNHAGAHNNLGTILQELSEFKKAMSCYKKTIQIDPNHADANNNLGIVFQELGEREKAKSCYEKAIQIDPNHAGAHNNLGIIFRELGEFKKAMSCYKKTIQIDPNHAEAHNNLGNVLKKLVEFKKAMSCYQEAIQIQPNYASAHNNLGIVFQELGEREKAKSCYEKTIQIDPNHADAYNNIGMVFRELGEFKKAKNFCQKAIQIDPNHTEAYWNLHSFAPNIDEALTVLKKLYNIDNKFFRAKSMISALQGFRGNFKDFDALLTSSEANHPYTRSIKWVFSLPRLPKIFFNRWDFFDAVIALTDKSRPFYEFGVWHGISFQHLINTFKKGFGFDTFNGLPEPWHDSQPKGAYSSFGSIPKISGGEFIVGKFKHTLPEFFSRKRPLASLINFDADLYSSTLCALNNSNEIIDEKTILIFDEFLINKNWEDDEYKALNEFCDNFNITYEVLAISFYSKQVAVKLNRKKRLG